MLKFYVSQYEGLCAGANQAVECVYNCIKKENKIWMYGDVLHNHKIMDEFISLGCEVVQNIEDIPDNSTVIIRAHGVSPIEINRLLSKNATIVDRTCPNVKKIHDIVKMQDSFKCKIIIFGNSLHPEIQGIEGWCSGRPLIVSSLKDFFLHEKEIEGFEKLAVVFQTTYDVGSYYKIRKILLEKYSNMEIHNTICFDSYFRQEEIKKIGNNCDLIIIVGGRHSSNTVKLFKIANKRCKTVHIECVDELNLECIKDKKNIGIFNGASTPLESIEEVINKIVFSYREIQINRL